MIGGGAGEREGTRESHDVATRTFDTGVRAKPLRVAPAPHGTLPGCRRDARSPWPVSGSEEPHGAISPP